MDFTICVSNNSHAGPQNTRDDATDDDDTTKPANAVRLVTVLSVNIASPQSVLEKLYFNKIHFNDELLATLCEPLSSDQCQLVELKFDCCRFRTLGPLWSALAVNKSISNLNFFFPEVEGEALGDDYGTQQLQSMLKTNITITELSFLGGYPPFPHSFFDALGVGLASNRTLKTLVLWDHRASEQGYITALFDGGLDRNVGLETFRLMVKELSDTQDLMSGLDRMAKNISTKRRADGSREVSTLKNLVVEFIDDLSFDEFVGDLKLVDCVKLVLDCLVRNKACFALKDLNLICLDDDEDYIHDSDLFDKLAAFIQAHPTVAALTMRGNSESTDDSKLAVLAKPLENNTTMTDFYVAGLHASSNWEDYNAWDPLDNPNHTHILCSVVRNRRELSMFLESSKRSLLPLALAALVKPYESGLEQIVNLTHAFHLVQNLPELFSIDD